MRLSFSILWFDDREDYFDSLNLAPLKKEIISWGFTPIIDTVSTAKDFIDRSPFKSYDLILVDRNLEDYENGEEFIANLRRNAIYTEVIFYTTRDASDLWELVRKHELEGVFVSLRDGIFEKIYKIGPQLIRKVLDLDNMRGIVMAEVGELDHLLNEIVTIGFENLQAEHQKEIYGDFHENASKQNKQTSKALEAFLENPETSVMISLCDSTKRWRNFSTLKKRHDKLKALPKLGSYESDILEPRNFLAHGRPEPLEGGGYIFRYNGKVFHFSDETSLELRFKILKYKNEFSIIKELLTNT